MSQKIPWPDDIVDASKLFGYIAGHLGAGPSSAASHRIYDRAYSLEQYVEKARRQGKIKRYGYQDPKSGETLALGYRKDDVNRLIGEADTHL